MNAAELQQKCLALESELRDRESELATLRELAQDLSQDVQAAKIIELSKKNRALNLALERERQRSAKLQADLSAGGGSSGRPASSSGAAAAPNVEAIEEVARSMVEKAAEAAEAAQREAAQWKDKLSQTTNKISQLEQKVFTLESENKKLTRALVREVGEDVPLAKVLDDSGSSEWKGRREQIIALRDQVKQLRAAAGQAPAETKQEAAAKGVINKIAKERNQEMDRLTSELVAVRGELDALKLKYDGAMSRRKILEAELSSVKAKVAGPRARGRGLRGPPSDPARPAWAGPAPAAPPPPPRTTTRSCGGSWARCGGESRSRRSRSTGRRQSFWRCSSAHQWRRHPRPGRGGPGAAAGLGAGAKWAAAGGRRSGMAPRSSNYGC
ncbi:Coiled-coil domain-containing protein 13 [Pleodorina starrii]|nr:Coiled-coil domain-containing protein 13 [Pleodorina starrii]